MDNTTNSRRQFIGALALGATASTISVLTNPLYAGIAPFDEAEMDRVDDWFGNIKGGHRIVYDGSTPHGGFPVIWNWAFYETNNSTGSSDEEITAMTVFRYKAMPLALNDAIWAKYPISETFNIKKADGSTYSRNPYYEPKAGDFPLPGVDGVKRLQERGALFCVCDLATKVLSNKIAKAVGADPATVYQEWIDNVLPGVELVPSGVWALGRAQKQGCGYIFAGE